MQDFKLEPVCVLKYFYEICNIPHGSRNMEMIAEYCVNFAKEHNLKFLRDKADNVIIFKNGSCGFENAEPLILQGHIDMVCAKEPDCNIDFLSDGLTLTADQDYISAKGTTLGADNGIAVAMIFAVLESDQIPHPPLQVVLTTDEEIGMIGAMALDTTPLTAKRMINLDSEEDDTVTVSCAGGSDFTAQIPLNRTTVNGTEITITLKGLAGGHSGVEINSGRVNAAKLGARVLNALLQEGVKLINICSGEKPNAIPNFCEIHICSNDVEQTTKKCEFILGQIANEISAREPNFNYQTVVGEASNYEVINETDTNLLVLSALCTKNGVIEMSAEIKGLVETSLNLGILKTDTDGAFLHFALRSNKNSALSALEADLTCFFKGSSANIKSFGHYPPWEFKPDSQLQEIYKDCYFKQYKKAPKVEAIHAGLECGVFSNKIENLDCISIGPTLFDVHTPNERLSISSLQNTYNLFLSILKSLK